MSRQATLSPPKPTTTTTPTLRIPTLEDPTPDNPLPQPIYDNESNASNSSAYTFTDSDEEATRFIASSSYYTALSASTLPTLPPSFFQHIHSTYDELVTEFIAVREYVVDQQRLLYSVSHQYATNISETTCYYDGEFRQLVNPFGAYDQDSISRLPMSSITFTMAPFNRSYSH